MPAGSPRWRSPSIAPTSDLLLIEQGSSFGGNHVWSFFDSDVDPAGRALVDPLVARRWPDHEVRFPKRQRRLDLGYNSVRSDLLDRALRDRLPADRYRLGCPIDAVAADHVMAGGERIAADCVIDARGAEAGPRARPGVAEIRRPDLSLQVRRIRSSAR